MKNHLSLTGVLLLIGLSAYCQSGGKPLFNGVDLNGWKVTGDISATVEEGAIVIRTEPSSEGGWLMNNNSYSDFELSVDFELEEGNNSGVTFRYNDELGGHPDVNAYEVNLDHNPDQQNPTGSIYNLARAKWLNSLARKGWHSMRIEAKGDHLKVFINDTIVTETHSRRAQRGSIGLQGHGGGKGHLVKFKNIKIRTTRSTGYLGPQIEDYLRSTVKRTSKSLFDGESLEGWKELGDGTWHVEEGTIYGKAGSEPAWLISDSVYQDFYMKLKFKISKEENSGVFIRNDPTTGLVGLETGLECNIYDHNGFGHTYSTGSIVTHSRAWSNMVDFDDWNTLEIFAFKDQVTLYVNGLKATEYHFDVSWVRAGQICLQAGTRVFADNGPSEVWFKDITIKNMDGIPFLGY